MNHEIRERHEKEVEIRLGWNKDGATKQKSVPENRHAL